MVKNQEKDNQSKTSKDGGRGMNWIDDGDFIACLCEIIHHKEFYEIENVFRHGTKNKKFTDVEVESYEYQMREWYHQIEKEKDKDE